MDPAVDGIRVLHVDDESDQLLFTKRFLEKADPALQVESVSSPKEALKKLNQRAFDCVVSDYKMPGMDGIELARKLRETRDIPIILFTGKGSEEVAEAAFNVGIDDYLRKEFDPSHYSVLAKRIRHLVEKYRAEETLRESEERLRQFIEYAPDAIYVSDIDGRFIEGNKQAEELTGFKREELIGKRMLEVGLLSEEYLPKALEGLEKNKHGEKFGPSEFELIKKDGSPIIVEISTFPVKRGGKVEVIGIARDITQRKRYENRLDALHNSSVKLASAENLEEVINITLETVERVFRFNWGGIGFVEGNAIRYLRVVGTDIPEGTRIPLDGPGISVRAVKTKMSQLVSDVRLDPDYVILENDESGRPKYLSELAVPIITDDKVDAVINIESEQLNAYTKNDQKLMETLASHTATAINRLRQLAELEERDRKLAALHYSAINFSLAESEDDIVAQALDTVEKILGFKRAGFAVVDSDLVRYIGVRGIETSLPVEIPLDGSSFTARVVKTGEPSRISDVRLEDDYVPLVLHEEFHPLSELVVPVKIDGEVIAVLSAESEQLDAFNEQDQMLMEILAAHVSTAFSTLQRQQEQMEHEEKLESLHRHALQLSAAENIDEIVENTLDAMEAALGFDIADFLMVEDGYIQVRGWRGAAPTILGLPLEGPGVVVKVVNTKSTVLVPDIRDEPVYVDARQVGEERLSILSELAVPVLIGDKAVAVLNVESTRLNAYDENDKRLLETLAQHVASTLNGLRRKEELKSLVEERTRELLDAERMVAAGRVASMVGHDLRGPLQTIKNAVYLLKQSPETTRDMVEMIEDAVERAVRMLEEFRYRTRETPLKAEIIDFAALIQTAIEEASPPASIDVVLDLGKGLEAVSLDPIKMRRVLDNLIRNAVEAMPDSGTLTVEVGRRGDDIILKVSDTGIGIPEEMMPYLFKPFHTTKSKGLGLGLAYCKRAVEAHGGTITAESKMGEGTTFTIILPIKKRR